MTCDGGDIISKDCYLPVNMEIGDWICVDGMGAYSSGVSTNFNGMKNDKCEHWSADLQ
jgi:diaminopimelate decarboxylase